VRYGIPATTRASFGVYTTTEELDALVAGVEAVKVMFS
jgi:cysteine desulfurase / selenocysteine lyase